MENKQSLDQQVEVAYHRLRKLLERSGASPEALEALATVSGELEAQAQEEAARRTAAQAALATERAFASTVLDTVGALVVVLDREGRIVRFNRMCEQATGYTFEEVKGRCFWDFLLSPEEVTPVRAAFDDLRGGRFPNEFENYWVARDGSRRPIAWTNTAIPAPDGGPEYIIGTGLDITQRRQAESQREAALEALRESEERFRTVADFTSDWEYWVGVDGRYLYVSPSCEHITGYRADEFMQNPGLLETIVHPDDRATVGRHLNERFESNEAMALDFRIFTRAGEERWISHVCTPVYGAGGHPLGRRASNRDITERKQAESQREAALSQREAALEELRETRDYLDNLLTYANAPIIVWDPSFKITRFNSAFERLTGLKAGDVLGRNLDILFPEERKEEAMAYIRRAVAGERWEVVEIPIRRVDGTVRTVLWNSATLYAADGTTAVATIAQGQDITERVQAEAERQQLLEENRRQRQFLEQLLEVAPIGVAVLRGPEHRYEFANAYYCAIPGTPDVPMVGHTVAEVFPAAAARGSLAEIEAVYRTGQTISVREYEANVGPGRERTYWDSDRVPLKAPDGSVEGVLIVAHEVTEEVLARRQVAELAARDEAILNSLAEGIITFDVNSNILTMNPAALRMYGFERIEQAQRPLAERARMFERRALDGRLLAADEWPVARALRGEPVSDYVAQARRVDTGQTWIGSYSCTPVRDKAGGVTMGVLTVRDITAQKQAELERERLLAELHVANEELQVSNEELQSQAEELEAQAEELRSQAEELHFQTLNLEEERARLRAIIDSAPEAILVADERGEVVLANPAAERLFAASAQGAGGPKNLGRVTHYRPDHTPYRPHELPFFRAAAHRETQRDVPVALLWPDGQWRDVLASAVPILDSRGQAHGAVAVYQDITERLQAEKALWVALEKYRVLIESFPLGITISDDTGQILETNKEGERLLGISQAERARRHIGGPEWRLIRPDGSPMPAEEFASVRALRENRLIDNVEMGIVKEGGDVTWLNVTAAPIPLEGYGVAVAYGDVTARKRAESALRDSERRFGSLVTSMTEGVALHSVIYDAQGQAVDYIILDVNPAFETTTGLSRDRAVGCKASELYGTGQPPYLETYSKVAASGEPASFETYFPPMEKHFSVSVFSPGPGQFATVFADITERKQAEAQREAALEELRETRDYLDNLLTYANAPIIVWDPDFKITRFNGAFECLTGLKAGDVLGRHLDILFPEERKEEAMAHIRRAAAGERWETVEILIRRVDGTVRTVLWNSATLYAADGATPVATIAQGQDITERVRVEAELRETRDYLDNLLTYANAPIIVWDPDFKITRFNGAFERLTGLKAGDVCGQSLDILFPEERKEEAMAYIRRAVAGERWEVVEIPILGASGTVRTVLWNSATLYAADGATPVATIAQGQDITERAEAEAERERLLEQARRDRESIASLAGILQQEWDTLQTIMESTHAQLAYLDPDFNFVRVNSAYVQGTGHSREEIIGHNHFDLFPNAENQAIFEQVRATGQPAVFHAKPFEFADQPERGVTYWDWTLVPVKEGEGQVRGLVLSLLDVTNQVLSRRAVEELAARDEAILNSLSEGVITFGPAGNILTINPAALRILGFGDIEQAERRLKETPNSFEARDLNGDVVPVEKSPQVRLMRGETFSGYELQVRDLATGSTWVGSFSGAAARDAAGDLAMGVLAVHDITAEKQLQSQRDAMLEELKAALAEKEVLMREIYHRVKNNVQALIYLMDMQAEYIPDEYTRQMVRELQERARAMALVHEKLYQSQNLAQIDFGDYLYDLVDNLSHAFGTDRPIVWHIDVQEVPLGVDTAIPCGLIVSELLTNALKYAFPGSQPSAERGETDCTISVMSRVDGDLITLVVADNGVGLPAEVDWETTKTLGLQLINILARHQLGGRVEVDRRAGTTFKITFADRERKRA